MITDGPVNAPVTQRRGPVRTRSNRTIGDPHLATEPRLRDQRPFLFGHCDKEDRLEPPNRSVAGSSVIGWGGGVHPGPRSRSVHYADPGRAPRGLPWGRILRALESAYSTGHWRVPALRARGADPFLVLVSTIVSQRTRDEVTERATLRLLARLPRPEDVARSRVSLIRSLIRDAGLGRTKAAALKRACQMITEEHGGSVPLLERDLLRLPMVGPKTAHAVRVFAHQRAGIPVDVHILRVVRRLGVARGSTITQVQRELAASVPQRYWKKLNPVLVQHGQNLCRSTHPRCEICPISQFCRRVGV